MKTQPDNVETNLLCCPVCGNALTSDGEDVTCISCGTVYPYHDGILSLMPPDLRTDYALTSEHSQLNQRARAIGWQAAIQEHLGRHHGASSTEYAHEYISSEARADFQYLLPLNNQSIVLDLGSGWGNIAAGIARSTKHVVAMDTNLENLDFVRLRAQQEGLNNITVVQGDACTLGARANTYDAVSMVGVLEWVAWGRNDGSPHALQQQALERVFRCLTPGGTLYLAIENRFSLKYFLGLREPHTKLRFVSLLPHRLGNYYSLLARKKPFREVTYSMPGLNNLLRAVGFTDIQFLFPVPGYQNFRYISDLRNRDVGHYLVEKLKTFPRFNNFYRIGAEALFTLPIGVVRYLWPTFAVLARRP